MKRLILTADDFGSSLAINDAIEEAHRDGVLSTASLMVAGGAAADAVERARRLPSLRVGLHLTLVDGFSISPPGAVPCLVNEQGEFSSRLFAAGVNFYFRAGVRRQLEQEIRAQFQAFRNTGLELDHANCHKHMHLHPVVGRLLVEVGREYGLKAVRYPCEPVLPSWRASRKGLGRKLLSRLFLLPWLLLLKRQLRKARMGSNRFVFGMNDSGNMHLDLVIRFIRNLPPGVTEIYFHPASNHLHAPDLAAADLSGEEEFAMLTSPTLKQTLRESTIQCMVFNDLSA